MPSKRPEIAVGSNVWHVKRSYSTGRKARYVTISFAHTSSIKHAPSPSSPYYSSCKGFDRPPEGLPHKDYLAVVKHYTVCARICVNASPVLDTTVSEPTHPKNHGRRLIFHVDIADVPNLALSDLGQGCRCLRLVDRGGPEDCGLDSRVLAREVH